MTRRLGVRCAGRLAEEDTDGGFTLIEVMVSLTVMSIFLAMFTTGIVQLFRSANNNEAVSTSQAQLSNAFMRLDKEIRYAAGISVPAPVGADTFVEYLTTNTGTAVCTELRLDVANAQLIVRTWKQDPSPTPPTPTPGAPSNLTAWVPLASGVAAAAPFAFLAADSTFNFQRLHLQLDATSGAGDTAVTKQTDVTFTALNTSLSTSSTSVCTEGRSAP